MKQQVRPFSFLFLLSLLSILIHPIDGRKRKCKSRYSYKINVSVSALESKSLFCNRDEMTAIKHRLDQKIQEIFDKEKLEMGIYYSKNKLTHFAASTRHRLLATTRLRRHRKPKTITAIIPITTSPGSLSKHVALPINYEGGFIPKFGGDGRCIARFCSKDNDDGRRRRLRLVEKGSWLWIKDNMEPKLSLECSNRLDGLYKNAKWDHCLKGKTAVVEVELVLKE